MKIIKLFLLLTFAIYAEFKLDIPNDINTSLLKKIIENGWNDSNHTLNTLIIKYGEKVMPDAIQKIKKPWIKVEPNTNEIFPVPKILLGRNDYFFILAYVKYLEYKEESDVALNMYIEILKGLNNTGDKSMLNFIFHWTIEEITIIGLNESLNKNVFSQSMKTRLKTEIKDFLILDTKDILIAIEGEKESIFKLNAISLASETSGDDVSSEYKKLTSEVHEHWKRYITLYFDRMYTAMEQKSPKLLKEFELFMDKEKEEWGSLRNKTFYILSTAKASVKNFLLIGNESYGFMSQHMGKSLALGSMPKMCAFFLDYLELIEQNKKFLNTL